MANPFSGSPVRAALFGRVDTADEAVRKLLDEGFRKEQITVICSEECQRHFGQFRDPERAEESHGGPLTGGIAGLAAGGLVSAIGVATTGGALLVAIGPLIAGGITGTLLGLLVSRGVEDELARFYDQGVAKGQILVAVEASEEHGQEELAKAERVFAAAGAQSFELRER